MGDFRVQIEAVGGHGCQRDVKDGQLVQASCGNANCPDCLAREFVAKLRENGCSVQSATLMHWPQMGPRIVDDLVGLKRTGSF